MSDLLGAWSLNRAHAYRMLEETDRRAMLAHLPGWPTRTCEYSSDRLWLVAGTSKMSASRSGCLAYEGFLPTPGPLAAEMTRFKHDFDAGRPPHPEGHFVMVHGGERLTLVRGLSGGERLYYAQLGELILFSTSIRPLLAHPSIGRSLFRDVINEVLLTGLTMFGDCSLAKGINELLPGHIIEIDDTVHHQRWHWNGFLSPPQGSQRVLARECHRVLGEAVALAAGRERPVAVTLSGGIDSSAVAALAVEAFSADNVVAFTYEFDDADHTSETGFAVEVANKLGIKRHHIFKLGFRDFLAHIPETVWRSEQITHWAKSFMIPVAKEIQQHGFDRFLTGFGVGSHMAFFGDFMHVLHKLPRKDAVLTHWKHGQFSDMRWPRLLAKLHPGLEPIPPRLYAITLAILQQKGRIENLAHFFPDLLHPLLEGLPERAARTLEDRPLEDLLRYHSFARLASCVDVTRWEKPMREVGIHRISPAHFASCIPYCYMPIEQELRLWSEQRNLRPGKLLLRLAMEGLLPDSVLYRKKNWADAVVSRRWSRAGLGWMRRVVGDSDAHLRPDIEGHQEAAREWDRQAPQATVTALGFWNRIFMEVPLRPEPPTWRDLLSCPEKAAEPPRTR